MQDYLDRTALLSLIVAVIVLVAVPLTAWYLREAHWRRLRQRGDRRAKQREAERHRRRRRQA